MQTENIKPEPQGYPEETTISLLDIVSFLSDEWKKMAIAAIVGALIGAMGWMAMSTYKAESVLINNGALTFMSWRGLQKNLPILASQLLETNRISDEEKAQFRQLANASWWQKNVLPTYSLTKADTKDLATISKELQESGGTHILNLVVTATGRTKTEAESNVEIVTRFIKHGSAYLSIKNLINGYESQVLSTESNLRKKILDAEIELRFMRDRAKNLDALRARFPANAAVSNQQIVDLNDSNAKFMPISTQIVAVNSDINNTTESLQRMQDQLMQIKTLDVFVSRARPILESQPDGLALADALLEIEVQMRRELLAADTNGLQVLNDIQATLVSMRTGFSKSLDTSLTPLVTKNSPMMLIVGGFLGGAILAVLVALARKTYARITPVLSRAG